MFTSKEFQQLHIAARLMQDKGLLQKLSLPALFCYLCLQASNENDFDLTGLAKQLSWSPERTRRCLKELASVKMDDMTPLVKVIQRQRTASGHFKSKRYRLVFQTTENAKSTKLNTEVKPLTRETREAEPSTGYPSMGQPQTVSPSSVSQSADKKRGFQPKTTSNHAPSGQKCPRCHAQKHHTKTSPCCCVNKTTTTKGGLQRGETTDPQHDPAKRAATSRRQLAEQLEKVGVEGDMVKELLENYPPERIATQLEMLPYRSARGKPAVLIDSIRKNYSPPPAYLDSKKQQDHSVQSANETQERFARIRAEAAEGKKRMEQLVALEKQLSDSEKNTLRRNAEKRVRQSLRHAWPQQKPLPETFLNAEYYRLVEARFSKRESGATNESTEK